MPKRFLKLYLAEHSSFIGQRYSILALKIYRTFNNPFVRIPLYPNSEF